MKNLTSLVNQNMRDVPLEIMVVNNAKDVTLKPGIGSEIGRFFRQHQEIRLINSRHNWRIYARYGLVYPALYDTILFLDDDIFFKDNDMVYDMYSTLQSLGKYDIVSCWNMLWKEWTDNTLTHVSASLLDPDLTKLTKTDTCGPGISMFNRCLVLDEQAQKYLIAWDLPEAGDMALGLLSNFLHGGTTYAIPSYMRVKFSKDFHKEALHLKEENFLSQRMQIFKQMLQSGYQPVITREPLSDTSPEMQLLNRVEPREVAW